MDQIFLQVQTPGTKNLQLYEGPGTRDTIGAIA